MSAAATAAGYLYASGRLRAKGKDEHAEGEHRRPARHEERHETHGEAHRRPVRIAAIRDPEPFEPPQPAVQPRPAVKVAYRTRRWRPALDE